MSSRIAASLRRGLIALFALFAISPLSSNGALAGVRHWVYFADRGPEDQAAPRLADFRASLAPEALDRRMRVLGPSGVDRYDLPPDPGYVAAVEAAGGRVRWQSRWLNAVSVEANAAALDRIGALACVRAVEPVRGAKRPLEVTAHSGPPSGTPEGGAGPRLDYGGTFDQLSEIGVVEVHQQGYTGAGVIVAMFDTGNDYTHPAFATLLSEGRLLDQYDFVYQDAHVGKDPGDAPTEHIHGMIVLSDVAAYVPGTAVGPAYGASFLLCKTEDVRSETPVEEDNWVAAAEWADQRGAQVFSTSLTYYDWYTYEDMDGNTAPITIASDLAAGRGIAVFAGAGNNGTQDWYYISAPADGDSVVAVGAVDIFNQHSGFSSHGPSYDGRIKPDVMARGIGVYGALDLEYYGALWGEADGTSVATPLVSGAAALLLEAHPTWTGMDVRDALRETADRSSQPDNDYGWGRIRLDHAIAWTSAVEDANRPKLVLGLGSNPGVAPLTLFLRGSSSVEVGGANTLVLRLFDPVGREIRALPGAEGVWTWDGRDSRGKAVSRGTYFARVESPRGAVTRKLTLQR